MPAVQPSDTHPAVPARAGSHARHRPFAARLRLGATGGFRVLLAWGMLLYGAVAGALVVVSWVRGDSTWWSYIANMTVILWLAPCVVFLACAVWWRWWPVAVASLTGAVVWLAAFGPLFLPQWPHAGASVRVVSYNVSPEPEVDHIARLVERTRPDVLLLQEVLPQERDELVRAVPSLPHHRFAPVNHAAPGGGGTAVLSRLPVVDVTPIGGLPATSRPTDYVTLDTGAGELHVTSVHLTSPCATCMHDDAPLTDTETLEYEAGLRRREAQRIAAALPDGPVVVGGDFNSGVFNEPRRLLLAAGLVDLHRAAGWGPGFTRAYRRGRFRIDWLLASPDVTAARVWVDGQPGSDHRPVVADVALPEA